MSDKFDAIVVGGGLSGVAAVAALARVGLTILHVAPKAPTDRRTSALMQPSVDYLVGGPFDEIDAAISMAGTDLFPQDTE